MGGVCIPSSKGGGERKRRKISSQQHLIHTSRADLPHTLISYSSIAFTSAPALTNSSTTPNGLRHCISVTLPRQTTHQTVHQLSSQPASSPLPHLPSTSRVLTTTPASYSHLAPLPYLLQNKHRHRNVRPMYRF